MSQIEFYPSILSQSANKTILITGGARGIGAATAALFNHHGANVVLADLAQFQETAECLITSTFTNPQRAMFVPGNIVDWVQLTSCFKAAIDRFKGIDVVANAGIMESSPVLDMDCVDENGDLRESTEAHRVIDVNLKGALNTPKSILLVGSTSSYFGSTGVTAYVASKHGVLGLLRASQSTASDLGVRINGIAPFLTPTHITAGFAQRWKDQGLEANTPERVAEVIALVALDETRHGQCVLVAGRYLLELESSRTKLLPTWIGEEVAEFMKRAMQFFVGIGGYVLPKKY